ncbi:MAG TPA: response regulator [Polyangiaceae bacterium]|nr:response regulator [Polyangiaceae bacterium]
MSTSARQPKILLVEDDQDSREMLAELLTQLGCAVRSAATGEEALALVVERPDVVIIDVGLPDLPGSEVARRVRSIHGATTRLIAATGYSSGSSFEDVLTAEFDEILTKPVTFDVWKRVVVELQEDQGTPSAGPT